MASLRQDAIAILKQASTDRRYALRRADAAEALLKLRCVDEAQDTLRSARWSGRKREKVAKGIATLRSRCREWLPLLELASRNEMTTRLEDAVGMIEGREIKVSEAVGHKIVEFHIGTYFGTVATSSDSATHAKICAFQRGVLRALSDDGFVIVPQHQYWLHIARPSGRWGAISYHTRGSAEGWLHLKDAALPGLYRLDTRGYAGWSELADLEDLPTSVDSVPPATVDAAWNRTIEQIVVSKRSKYRQTGKQFVPPGRPYIFFPLQQLNDTVASLAWIPMMDAVGAAYRAAKRRGMALVVKRHPLCCRQDVQDFLREIATDDDVVVTGSPIFDILDGAEVVVTVNSGVGLEALLRGCRVITVGRSEYGVATERARSVGELEELLLGSSAMPEIASKKKYIWLYRSRCVEAGIFDPIVSWANQEWSRRSALQM